MANKISFLRENGGIPKSLVGEDHYSGFLMYADSLPAAEEGVTGGFSQDNRIVAISTIETAEKFGITSDADNWEIKVLHYHLSECFRINPKIALWVGLFKRPTPSESYTFNEVKKLQNYAEGKIRQMAVFTPDLALSSNSITALQGVADTLSEEDTPLSILYGAKITDINNLEDMTGSAKNVSVVIGQDGEGTAKALFDEKMEEVENVQTPGASVTVLGLVLGMVSAASVHESIAWVQKFPAGISVPAFADGKLVKETDRTKINTLDGQHYLFLIKHGGLSGSYMNDSYTLDEKTSDYNTIESVRTMDKAVRGIRTYLLPHLSCPLYVDAETGKLSADMVSFLQTTAGRQLEDMERAGELSGYVVEVDPDQNVLATSQVEFVIKNVPVGVMRNVIVKIGFTTKLN